MILKTVDESISLCINNYKKIITIICAKERSNEYGSAALRQEHSLKARDTWISVPVPVAGL